MANKTIDITFQEKDIPTPEKNPQDYVAKLPKTDDKLVLYTEDSYQNRGRFYPKELYMTLGYIRVENDKPIINPICPSVTCREQLISTAIMGYSGRKLNKNVMVGMDSITLNSHVYNYINGKCLVIMFGGYFDENHLREGLGIIHNLEEEAKCGKTEILPIAKNIISSDGKIGKEPKGNTMSIGGNFALVVPRVWTSSPPMLSFYLLLIRLLAYQNPVNKGKAPKNLLDYYNEYIKKSRKTDAAYLTSVMQMHPALVETLAKKWRYLAGSYKHKKDWLGLSGTWGIDKAVRLLQDVGGTKNNPHKNPLTGRAFSKAQKEAFMMKTLYDHTGGTSNYIVAARMLKIYRGLPVEKKKTPTKKTKKRSA